MKDYPQDLCYCPACRRVIWMRVDPDWPRNEEGRYVHECQVCQAKPKKKAAPGRGLFGGDKP